MRGISAHQLADKIDAKPWVPAPTSRSQVGKKIFQTGMSKESWESTEPGLLGDVWVRFNPTFVDDARAGPGRKDTRKLEFKKEGEMVKLAARLLAELEASHW